MSCTGTGRKEKPPGLPGGINIELWTAGLGNTQFLVSVNSTPLLEMLVFSLLCKRELMAA